jgi:hypothetical protein
LSKIIIIIIIIIKTKAPSYTEIFPTSHHHNVTTKNITKQISTVARTASLAAELNAYNDTVATRCQVPEASGFSRLVT